MQLIPPVPSILGTPIPLLVKCVVVVVKPALKTCPHGSGVSLLLLLVTVSWISFLSPVIPGTIVPIVLPLLLYAKTMHSTHSKI
jgi:hypothetical protein